MRRVKWQELKSLFDIHASMPSRAIYSDDGNFYQVTLKHSQIDVICPIAKDVSPSADQTDWETNYKSQANDISNSIDVNIISNTSTSPACPTISPKLKTHFSNSDIALTSSHATVFENTGNGNLFSFAMEFNSNRVALRLEVDGNEIFDYKLREEIEGFARFHSNGKSNGSMDQFFRLGSNDRLLFEPPCPIAYGTNFKIQAKETNGNRTVDWINVYYTDES